MLHRLVANKLYRLRKASLLMGLALLICNYSMGSVSAISDSQLQLFQSGVLYFDSTGGGSSSTGSLTCDNSPSANNGTVSGNTISSNVPAVYQSVISNGAAAYNADPDLVAAIFAQENGAAWPSPTTAWPVSPTGASGPMQIEPGTWSDNAVSAPNSGDGGTPDINNLADAIYTGAKIIASLGGTNGITLGNVNLPLENNTALRVAAAYNWGPGSVQAAGPDFPLANLNGQTKAYVENVYTMLNSNFTDMPGGSGSAGGSQPPASTGPNGTGPNDCSTISPAECNNGTTVADRVVACAEAELALWTGPNPSMTPGTSYFKYQNNRNNPEPWCADFTSWIYNQAGAPMSDPAGKAWDVSYVPNINTQAPPFQFHTYGSYTPQPGDLAIFDGAHVEIVISVNSDGTITMIGGDEGGTGGGAQWWGSSRVQEDVDVTPQSLQSGVFGGPITGFESYNG